MKSLIYTTNSTATVVAPGSRVPVGYVQRRLGCDFNVNGDNIFINKAGYYLIDFSATITAGAAGDVKLNLVQNGETIASSTESIATANTLFHTAAIPGVVRVYCCAGATVSIEVDATSTATPTIQSSALRIVRY
ncbi:MAG: hypothetical protein KBT27_13335 [Prevotellaceae bacterium]|nr:hypothetical protein [Candidatus Faecinaster equi]